jgi:hypothetical protein
LRGRRRDDRGGCAGKPGSFEEITAICSGGLAAFRHDSPSDGETGRDNWSKALVGSELSPGWQFRQAQFGKADMPLPLPPIDRVSRYCVSALGKIRNLNPAGDRRRAGSLDSSFGQCELGRGRSPQPLDRNGKAIDIARF